MLLLKYVLVEPFPLHDSAMKGKVAKVLVESTTLQCYGGSS